MSKIVRNIKGKVQEIFYVAGLILNRKRRQVCTNIGEVLNVSHDKVYRALKKGSENTVFFDESIVKVIELIEQEKIGDIIIDDTGISKFYGPLIEAISGFYNTAIKKYDYGFKLFVIVWTCGNHTIPIGFKYFLSKEISGKEHQTKASIVKELIDGITPDIKYNYLLGDGHFSTIEIMKFLIERNIPFIFKIAKNKKVLTADGINKQIQKHPNFKMQRNQKSKVITIEYYGMVLHVSIHKFKNPKTLEWSYVYIVSNVLMIAKTYLQIYKKRWKIEVFFRAIKQDLGLGHCQSRHFKIQQAHTKAVFIAYIFLQYQKFLNHKNIYSVAKSQQLVSSISAFNRNFGYYA
jgi:hypothetical protein